MARGYNGTGVQHLDGKIKIEFKVVEVESSFRGIQRQKKLKTKTINK